MKFKVGAERLVSFDHGLEGSVTEDCYFAMRAFKQGYSFNFIEGEMWEKSPFTLWDFVQQRKRWLQGILLVVHSKNIPVRNKLLLAASCYSSVTMPLTTICAIVNTFYPIPCPPLMDFLFTFMGAVSIYMYVFGIIKSFSLYHASMLKCMLCVCGVLLTIPFNCFLENVAVIWAICGHRNKFYIVNKEIRP